MPDTQSSEESVSLNDFMKSPEAKKLIDMSLSETRKEHPEFTEFADRLYRFPPKFPSMKELYANIAMGKMLITTEKAKAKHKLSVYPEGTPPVILQKIYQDHMASIQSCFNTDYIFTCAQKYDFPVFAVSPTLTRALQLTKLPDAVDVSVIPKLIPVSYYVFEEGAIPVGEGAYITHMGVVWNDGTDDVITNPAHFTVRRTGLIGFAMTNEKITYDFFRYTEEDNPSEIRFDKEIKINFSFEERVKSSSFLSKLEIGHLMPDEEIIPMLTSLAFQLLFIRSSKPDVTDWNYGNPEISGGGLIKTTKKKKRIYAPRKLGFKYDVKRSSGGSSKEAAEGKRKSPEPHWRDGTWRNQRYGKGNSKIKQIWIEPVWVDPS